MAKKGEYQTRQKACLLDYLESNADRHVTAGELIRALDALGTPLSVSTVYRQLERLEFEGLVRRYTIDDRGSACWQYSGGTQSCHTHFHLKCTRCSRLFHLDCAHLNEIAAHVAEDHGFQIDPGRTVFYGICADCQAKSQNNGKETEA